jgi:PD-(D/E)XK endonuclease
LKEFMGMDGDGVEVELGELGGISIWGMAESEFESGSKGKARSKAGSKAGSKASDPSAGLRAGRSVRSTQAGSTQAGLVPAEGMTPKELGELAEAEFLRRALGMGMAIAKPWGESQAYDFIVDDEGRLCRVQVKAAFRKGPQGGYSLRAYRSSKKCYTAKEIDALAGYAAPENAWYFFPVRVIRKVKSLKLFPGSKGGRSKFEKWREAWGVVRGKVRR